MMRTLIEVDVNAWTGGARFLMVPVHSICHVCVKSCAHVSAGLRGHERSKLNGEKYVSTLLTRHHTPSCQSGVQTGMNGHARRVCAVVFDVVAAVWGRGCGSGCAAYTTTLRSDKKM